MNYTCTVDIVVCVTSSCSENRLCAVCFVLFLPLGCVCLHMDIIYVCGILFLVVISRRGVFRRFVFIYLFFYFIFSFY